MLDFHQKNMHLHNFGSNKLFFQNDKFTYEIFNFFIVTHFFFWTN